MKLLVSWQTDQPVGSQNDLQYQILTPPDNVSEKSEQVDLTVEFECLCEFLYELTSMCEFACILYGVCIF